MQITFVSPRIAIQKGDFLGSGIPYWPIEMAVAVAFARDRGAKVSVIDLFGASPRTLADMGDHYLQGHSIERYYQDPRFQNSDVVLVYALSYMSHSEVLRIVGMIRRQRPLVPIVILENSQAVTGYALDAVKVDFFNAGANVIICGEPYANWDSIFSYVTGEIDACPPNVLIPGGHRKVQRLYDKSLSSYPIPAWELFNLRNYWSLPYSHGPKTRRFFPVLTSRGCPYPCDFCVVPETNDRTWRARSAEDVVNELTVLRDRFGVRDFQIEDLNPTIQHWRWSEIAERLIKQKADIRFYFVSGTKAETVKLDQVPNLAAAGCRYLSISPETGSNLLLKKIGKRFDHEHALRLVAACRNSKIRTQACFLVGHPDESEADFDQSVQYIRQLVEAGLDEVAIFIVAPFAGSELFRSDRLSLSGEGSVISFSPTARASYGELERCRRKLILTFLKAKFLKGPALWLQGFRALVGTPQTKMENLPRRILYVFWLIFRFRLIRFLAFEPGPR